MRLDKSGEHTVAFEIVMCCCAAVFLFGFIEASCEEDMRAFDDEGLDETVITAD